MLSCLCFTRKYLWPPGLWLELSIWGWGPGLGISNHCQQMASASRSFRTVGLVWAHLPVPRHSSGRLNAQLVSICLSRQLFFQQLVRAHKPWEWTIWIRVSLVAFWVSEWGMVQLPFPKEWLLRHMAEWEASNAAMTTAMCHPDTAHVHDLHPRHDFDFCGVSGLHSSETRWHSLYLRYLWTIPIKCHLG